MIKIPKQYKDNARLINAYNDGYKMGYNDDRHPVHVRDDAERLAHQRGWTDGHEAREREAG